MTGVSTAVATTGLAAKGRPRAHRPRGRDRSRRGRRWSLLSLLFVVASLLLPPAAEAQDVDGPTVLVVVDASGSMAREDADGTDLMSVTRTAVDALLDRLPAGSQVGIRAYGHRIGNSEDLRDEGCVDTELLAPVGAGNDQVRAAVDGLEPTGWTALGSALAGAADDLAGVDQATVVVISDGEDNCRTPEPCAAVAPFADESSGIVVDTIGLLLDTDVAARQLRCVAQATGGRFASAQDAETLSDVIRRSAVRGLRRHRNRLASATGSATPPVDPTLPTQGRSRTIEGTERPDDAPVIQAGRQHLQHVEGSAVLHYRLGDVGPGDSVDLQVDRTPSAARDTGYVAFWADVIDADGRWITALAPGPHGPEVTARATAIDVAVLDRPAPYLLRIEVAAAGGGDPPPQDLVIRLQHDPTGVDPGADGPAAGASTTTLARSGQPVEAPSQSGLVVLGGVVLVLVAGGILTFSLAQRWRRTRSIT